MPTKLLIAAVTINAVIGQLFLKRAITALGGKPALEDLPRFLLSAMKSPWLYTSLSIQALGYVLWMLLIVRVKLGVATASVGAGFYVLMAVCAWAVYGESLTYVQWIGLGLITAGVTCVGSGSI